MTALDAVLERYVQTEELHRVVLHLIHTAPETIPQDSIFATKTPPEARELLDAIKAEQEHLAVFALVSVFERLLFGSIPKSQRRRKRLKTVKDLLAVFRARTDAAVYKSVSELFEYRHWIAHGQRWKKPLVQTDPRSAHRVLSQFFHQAGIVSSPVP